MKIAIARTGARTAALARRIGVCVLLLLCDASLAAPLDWHAIAATDGVVNAMTVFDDGTGPVLIAAGSFNVAGGVPVRSIARWDGISWSALGNGIVSPSQGEVYALAVYDDGSGPKLYAGGQFLAGDGVPANLITVWNGSTSWLPVGGSGSPQVGDQVRALAVFDSGSGTRLIAGGRFASLGGIAAANTAAFDGSNWSAFGGGTDGPVIALRVHAAQLYAGGEFGTVNGGTPANRMARFNGTNWFPFSSGFTNGSDVIFALGDSSVSGASRLYVGGQFTNAAGVPANYVAMYTDPVIWSALGSGANQGANAPVSALAEFDDGVDTLLYVGGFFSTVAGSTLVVDNIAAWNGSAWSALGAGVNGGVGAMQPYLNDAYGPALYVGGAFFEAGDVPSPGIARYGRDEQFRLRMVRAGGTGAISRVHSNELPAPALDCPGVCDAFYLPGDPQVMLTAEPGPGAAFVTWLGDCSGTDTSILVTMDQPRNCIADFEAGATLTVTRSGAGSGNVASLPAGIDCGATCSALYVNPSVIVLTATPANGSVFVDWGVDCAGAQNQVNVNLNGDRTCDAEFAIARTLSIDAFTGGSVNSSPVGIACPSGACSGAFAINSTVELTAGTANGFRFSHWIGACSGSDPVTQIVMSAHQSCMPIFIARYGLTVSLAGSGSGSVDSSPTGIDCGVDCDEVYDAGTDVTLTAHPAAGTVFTGWSGAAACSGSNLVLVVDLQQHTLCTATFQLERTLAFTLSGQGHVTVPQAGLDCTTACNAVVADGTSITVTAVPDAGWEFSGWGDDCAFANPAASFTQPLNSHLQCTASFLEQRKLTVSVSGAAGGGSVQSNAPSIDCPTTCFYYPPAGASVTLTAVSSSPGFYGFVAWQGDCSSFGSNPVATVSMTEARSCTAEFEIMPYLEMGVIGDGHISVPQAGLDCPENGDTAHCFKRLPTGTPVTLTAIPNPPAIFVRWYNTCSGTNPVHPLTIDDNKHCYAEFIGGRRIYASGFEAP